MGSESVSWLALGPGWLFTAIAVIMVLRGRLIPRAMHLEAIAQRDRQTELAIEDRDTWQEAYELSQRNYQLLADKAAASVELGQTTVELIRAVKDQRS
jgi:hypothetical protein